MGTDPLFRRRSAVSSRARATGGTRIDRAPEERRQGAATQEDARNHCGHRSQRRSAAHAARQLQRRAGGSRHAVARRPRSRVSGHEGALRTGIGSRRELSRARAGLRWSARAPRRSPRRAGGVLRQREDGRACRLHVHRRHHQLALGRASASTRSRPGRFRRSLDRQLYAAARRHVPPGTHWHDEVSAVPERHPGVSLRVSDTRRRVSRSTSRAECSAAARGRTTLRTARGRAGDVR